MPLVKKLTFAPLFLIAFALLISKAHALLGSYDFIFSLSFNTLIDLIAIAALFVFASFLFILFATFASDWKIILPVGIFASLIPFAFTEPPLALIFSVAIFASLLLTSLGLDGTLKSYLNFQPHTLLGPHIRNFTGLLIISFCLVYFFSASKLVSQKGFQIPDTLIDTALKFTPQAPDLQEGQTGLPQIPTEQLDLLKKNPDLLKQAGLSPQMLDNLINQQQTTKTNPVNDLIKKTIQEQIQNFIKPYTSFIPALLTLLLFLTLQTFSSFVNILVYPLLWLIFLILEKTGFTKYEAETRQIRKLTV